jgi:hypothetical protein
MWHKSQGKKENRSFNPTCICWFSSCPPSWIAIGWCSAIGSGSSCGKYSWWVPSCASNCNTTCCSQKCVMMILKFVKSRLDGKHSHELTKSPRVFCVIYQASREASAFFNNPTRGKARHLRHQSQPAKFRICHLNIQRMLSG